jgi:hypothetical protein
MSGHAAPEKNRSATNALAAILALYLYAPFLF